MAGLAVSTRASATPPEPLVLAAEVALERFAEELASVSPDGLTVDVVAARAAANSFTAEAALASAEEAAAVVSRARAAFLPRIVTLARATRVSEPEKPPGPTAYSVVIAPPGSAGPIVAAPASGSAAAPGTTPLTATPIDLSYRPLRNQYTLQANLTVPLSDYFTRLAHLRSSALHGAAAARLDAAAAAARAAAEGRVSYFEWLRARASVVLAVETLHAARSHRTDVHNHMNAGLATQADLLQAETALLQAEISAVNARSEVLISEAVVRCALRAPESERLVPADRLDAAPSAVAGEAVQLAAEALRARPELKSIDERAAAAGARSRASRSAALPALSLSGTAYYANPAPRQVQQRDEWALAWDASIQVTWAVSDIWDTRGAVSELSARARALHADAGQLAQAIALDTRRAFETLRARLEDVELAERMVASATGAVRAARDLFASNEATAQGVLLAERDLNRARSTRLYALADAWIARARLDQALGRSL